MDHPDPDQLALAALPSEPLDPVVNGHLDRCRLCRDHVAALRRTVDLARDGSPDSAAEMPPDRVWHAIAADITPLAAPQPHRRPALARRTTATIAAITLVIGLGTGWVVGQQQSRAPIIAVSELRPLIPGKSAATATATLSPGGTLNVSLNHAPAPPTGSYLEVWLTDSAVRDTISLGALRTEGAGGHATLTLPPGLPDQHFTTLDISLEPLIGAPGHSGTSMLRGKLL